MTINYPDEFSSALLRWRGSLYKAVLPDILLFYLLYYIVFVMQVLFLDEEQRVYMSKLIGM
jgi:predicted membrane chloride channel (bestrophin family)